MKTIYAVIQVEDDVDMNRLMYDIWNSPKSNIISTSATEDEELKEFLNPSIKHTYPTIGDRSWHRCARPGE